MYMLNTCVQILQRPTYSTKPGNHSTSASPSEAGDLRLPSPNLSGPSSLVNHPEMLMPI